MKKILFVFLLLSFTSCGQTVFEFKLLNSFPVKINNPVCIDKESCFCFSSDSNLYYLVMHYSDKECEVKQLVDSVEFSPYKSAMHSFKAPKTNSYVILWETQYEYYPIILAYHIEQGTITKMGEIDIALPCQSCESFEYPVKDIRIIQKKDDIEISFLKDASHKEKGNSEWKLFKAGTLKYYYNSTTGEFRTNR